MQGKFPYLNTELGVLLGFVGIKMLLIGDRFEILLAPYISLAFIALVLTVSVIWSFRADRSDRDHEEPPHGLPVSMLLPSTSRRRRPRTPSKPHRTARRRSRLNVA